MIIHMGRIVAFVYCQPAFMDDISGCHATYDTKGMNIHNYPQKSGAEKRGKKVR